MVTFILVLIIASVLWLAYEAWRAPLVDHNNNIITPAKKLRDLFKKK
jgi:hypothetical protein